MACDGLAAADRGGQVAIVESAPQQCAPVLVTLLKADPTRFLDAFGDLISRPSVTEPLFLATYEELRLGRFRFSPPVVEEFLRRLPGAIAACSALSRCADWNTFILSRGLYVGEMYQCPDVATMGAAALLDSIPYGDYSCTEATATAFGNLAFGSASAEAAIRVLILLTETRPSGWSRRNALRVIGRLAELPAGRAARGLVLSTYASTVKAMLYRRLQQDRSEDVIADALWILDSFYYPNLEMQKFSERIASDPGFSPALRHRAMRTFTRLVNSKISPISEHDLAFILRSMNSDDVWIRAEAAFLTETLQVAQLTPTVRSRIVAALSANWRVEAELTARVYVARALDFFNGSSLFSTLKAVHEAANLGNTHSAGGVSIRSGLDAVELPGFAALMEATRNAFFDIAGPTFATPVPNDVNASMTLFLFRTRDRYIEYMSLFVGYGQYAGGLYLEDRNTLYTYQRTPAESTLTVEELVQHEYGHYLQGRYVYPGLWGDADYHSEPKGWIDEGIAEVLGGAVFGTSGAYSLPLRRAHLSNLCGTQPSLGGLLSLRAGYDQAGEFDYASAWGFSYFLTNTYRDTLRRILASFRNSTYQRSAFDQIAGKTSADLEREWHGAILSWCATPQSSSTPSMSHKGGAEAVLRLRSLVRP